MIRARAIRDKSNLEGMRAAIASDCVANTQSQAVAAKTHAHEALEKENVLTLQRMCQVAAKNPFESPFLPAPPTNIGVHHPSPDEKDAALAPGSSRIACGRLSDAKDLVERYCITHNLALDPYALLTSLTGHKGAPNARDAAAFRTKAPSHGVEVASSSRKAKAALAEVSEARKRASVVQTTAVAARAKALAASSLGE
ncbi:hypothetical protein HDU96_004228, partial [Phlyctochytrium bullatum]